MAIKDVKNNKRKTNSTKPFTYYDALAGKNVTVQRTTTYYDKLAGESKTIGSNGVAANPIARPSSFRSQLADEKDSAYKKAMEEASDRSAAQAARLQQQRARTQDIRNNPDQYINNLIDQYNRTMTAVEKGNMGSEYAAQTFANLDRSYRDIAAQMRQAGIDAPDYYETLSALQGGSQTAGKHYTAEAMRDSNQLALDAGQQQFLNTLTDPNEKLEYLMSVDPARANTMLENMEQSAKNWMEIYRKQLEELTPTQTPYLRYGEGAATTASDSEASKRNAEIRSLQNRLAEAESDYNALSNREWYAEMQKYPAIVFDRARKQGNEEQADIAWNYLSATDPTRAKQMAEEILAEMTRERQELVDRHNADPFSFDDESDQRWAYLDEEITKWNELLHRATYQMEGVRMGDVAKEGSESYDPRFAEFSQYNSIGEYLEPEQMNVAGRIYEYINNDDTAYRMRLAAETDTLTSIPYAADFEKYQLMNEDEIALFNYYYVNDPEQALHYLDTLSETLNYRAAVKDYKENWKGKPWKEALLGSGQSGFNQYLAGSESVGHMIAGDNYIPTTKGEYLAGMMRDDLSDSALATGVFDVGSSITNMLPSVLVSSVSPVAGKIVFGASVTGNAYKEAVNKGFDPKAAKLYSVAIGAAEVFLQDSLAGISKMSGANNLTDKVVNGLLSKVDNALARAAIQLGVSSMGEATEEYLQEIIGPVLENIILGAHNEIHLITEEAIYAGILGAFTALPMNLASPGTDGFIGNLGTAMRENLVATVNKPYASEVVSEAKTYNADSETLKRIEKQIEKGGADNVSKRDLALLVQETQEAKANAEVSTQTAGEGIRSDAAPEQTAEHAGTSQSGAKPFRGTNAVRVASVDETGIAVQTSDGKTVNLNSVKQEGTALEVLRYVTEDSGMDAATVNDMVRFYEWYLNNGKSSAGKASRFYNLYQTAVDLGRTGADIREVQELTDDRSMKNALEAAYARGQTIAKGEQAAAEMGVNGAAALRSFSYAQLPAFQQYYAAGRDGMSLAETQRKYKVNKKYMAEMKAAFNAGRKDAVYGKTEERRNTVSDGISERTSGMDSGKSNRKVEQRTGEHQKPGWTSGYEINADGGTVSRTLRILDESEHTEEMKKILADGSQRGISIHFFEGYIEIEKNGKFFRAKGLQKGTEIFVASESKAATPQMIYRHELVHSMIRSGKIKLDDLVKTVKKNIGESEWKKILPQYRQAYWGLYSDSKTEYEEYVNEELCADVVAGRIKGFKVDLDDLMFEAESKPQKEETQTQKLLIVENNGKPYVQADRKVLHGDDPSIWGKEIETYINEKIRKGKDVLIPTEDGHVLVLTERSAYKLTDRHESKIIAEAKGLLADQLYSVKLQAAAHIDELIRVGKFEGFKPDENNKHENDIGEDGFNYYTAFFQDTDGIRYRFAITAALNENEETAYSIGAIRKRKPTTGRGPSARKSGAQNGGKLPSESIIYTSEGKSQQKTAMQEAMEKAKAKAEKAYIDVDEPASSGEYRYLKAAGKIKSEQAAQVEKVQEYLQTSKMETRRLMGSGTVRKITKSVAVETAREMRSRYGQDSISQEDLQEGIARIARLTAETESAVEAYRQAEYEALAIASRMVDNAAGKTIEAKQDYNGIRKMFRSQRLVVEAVDRKLLEASGGYDLMREHLRGRVLLSASGTPIDQFYDEVLAKNYPQYFPPEITTPADQLLRIVDVLDRFRGIFRNPASGVTKDITEIIAQDLLQLLYNDTAPNRTAEADARLHEEMVKAYYENKINEVKAAWQDDIERMKLDLEKKRLDQRTAKKEKEDRDKLLHIARRLSRIRVGSMWYDQARELLGNIDTVAKSMLGVTVIGDYIGNVSSESVPDVGTNDRGRKIVNVEALEAWVRERQESDPDFNPDGKTMEKLARLKGKKIAEMEIGQVRDLLNAMLHFEHEMRNSKKLINAQDKRELSAQAADIRSHLEEGGKKINLGLKKVMEKWKLSTLDPIHFFRMLTAHYETDPMMRAAEDLLKGEGQMHDYIRKAEASMQGFQDDPAFMRSITGKSARTIEITGRTADGMKTVRITPDMAIAILLHSKNWENIRHIEDGGLRIPNYDLLMRGAVDAAYNQRAEVMRFRKSDLEAIAAKLTDKERSYAAKLQRYYNETSKNALNATSRDLLGYDRYTVPNYYPIEVNKDLTGKKMETVAKDNSLETPGFSKERKNSANEIILRGATETFGKMVKAHAKYYGMAIPVRNFSKLYGQTIWEINDSDGEGEHREGHDIYSVAKKMRENWGTEAVNYVEKLLGQIQNPTRPGEDIDRLANKIRGNYARAVLTANLSVTAKQVSAYPTAAMVTGWKALNKALVSQRTGDPALIAKYSPWLWHRSQGSMSKELGDLAKGKRKSEFVEKLENATDWVGWMDTAVVKKLWVAAEYCVKERRPDLQAGTDRFYQETAKIFDEIIMETQPDNSLMLRPQALRSERTFIRMLNTFKGQAYLTFNTAFDSVNNLQAKERQLKAAEAALKNDNSEEARAAAEKARQAVNDAKHQAARTFSALLVSQATSSAIAILYALLRGKTKDFEDEEGKLKVGKMLAGFGKDIVSNMAGIVPFGTEIYDAIMAFFFKETYYGLDLIALESLQTVAEQLIKIPEMAGSVRSMLKGEAPVADTVQHLLDLSSSVCKLFGIPQDNMETLVKIPVLWIMRAAMPKNEAEYWYRYWTEKATAKNRKKNDYNNLFWTALDGDMDAYKKMRGKLWKIIWQTNSDFKDGEITKDEAKARATENINSNMQERIMELVLAGELKDAEAVQMLQEIAGMEQADAEDDVLIWKYKALSGSEEVRGAGQAMDYYLLAKPAKISIEVYEAFLSFKSNRKKAEVIEYIDKLKLTDAQKDALYLCEYAESGLKKTPWH